MIISSGAESIKTAGVVKIHGYTNTYRSSENTPKIAFRLDHPSLTALKELMINYNTFVFTCIEYNR